MCVHVCAGREEGLEWEAQAYEKVDELPFDFVRRRLSVVLQVLVGCGVWGQGSASAGALADGEPLRARTLRGPAISARAWLPALAACKR